MNNCERFEHVFRTLNRETMTQSELPSALGKRACCRRLDLFR